MMGGGVGEMDDSEDDMGLDGGVYKLDANRMRNETTPEAQGCTANVVVYIPPTEDAPFGTLVCANAGDSRAVLSRGGKAYPLSEDHKPESDIEKTRIIKAGGTVDTMAGGDVRVR